MKRAFILTTNRHLASALVPAGTQDCLNLGDRLTVSRPLDIAPDAQIKTGERGTVAHIDASTGSVEVLMDTPHKGLDAWDNHVLLEPFATDDIVGGLRRATGLRVPRVPKWAGIVSASVAISVLAAVAHNFFWVSPVYEFSLIHDAETAAVIFTRVLIITLAVASTVVATA